MRVFSSNEVLSDLNESQGIVEIFSFPGAIVFEDQYAKPIVYSNSTNASVDIISVDLTYYKIAANCTSPFTLIFNQVYNLGWTASVNGNPIPLI